MKSPILLLALILLTGCCEEYDEYNSAPVIKHRAEVEADVRMTPSRPIQKAGATVLYGDYLFVTDLYEGIHIIDNRIRQLHRRQHSFGSLAHTTLQLQEICFSLTTPAIYSLST
jgi:hypothetical protein